MILSAFDYKPIKIKREIKTIEKNGVKLHAYLNAGGNTTLDTIFTEDGDELIVDRCSWLGDCPQVAIKNMEKIKL